MAAPKEKSLQDLSGKWKMNREQSNDVDGVLKIQGFNTLMRKAIAMAPVYLHISQTTESSNTKYKIDQTTTANIPAVNEEWITDWKFRPSRDPVMGEVSARARWKKPSETFNADFLAEGWVDEGDEQIEGSVESLEGGWMAHQMWGFEEIEGQRKFVRRVIVRKNDEVEKVRLVYDFEGNQ